MDLSERFVKRSKRRMTRVEKLQSHATPRTNSHVASNTRTANSVLDDVLFSLRNESTGFICTYPVPIGPPGHVHGSIVKGFDPVQKIVEDKKVFKAMYDQVIKSEKLKSLTLEDIEKLSETAHNEDVITVHPSLVTFAQICSLDPDPYFAGDYNSYYGGDVAVMELQGRTTVVHTEQGHTSKLRMVAPDEENLLDISYVNHSMGAGPIYEVDSVSNMILLRQKKSCGLFRFNFDEEASLQKIAIVSSPEVFVSSSINPYKQDEFATVAPNSGIEIHDVQHKSKRSVEVEGVKDNWGHVHYHDENVLMFADRDSICICDLRESGSESLQWEIRDKTDLCDDVFAAAKGKFLHYISTKHYLLSLDIRAGLHQRWAHGLPNAPSLLNVVKNEGRNEALLVGSQCSGAIVYVENSPYGDFTSDITLPPLRLPSPRETLHMARIKGQLLSPITQSRFSLSLTGLVSFYQSGTIQIFSCNSVGDLFSQSITHNNRCDTTVEPLSTFYLKRLRRWESQCLDHYWNETHEFKATRYVDLKHIVNVFEGPEIHPEEPSSPEHEVTTSRQPWNKSKKLLKAYRDVLASKLLAHWEIEDDDEWCDVDEDETVAGEASGGEESSDEEEDANARVLKWLQKYETSAE